MVLLISSIPKGKTLVSHQTVSLRSRVVKSLIELIFTFKLINLSTVTTVIAIIALIEIFLVLALFTSNPSLSSVFVPCTCPRHRHLGFAYCCLIAFMPLTRLAPSPGPSNTLQLIIIVQVAE